MEFKGFQVFPMGEAKLSIVDSKLRVENITDSGLDGVVINTRGYKEYNIYYSNMPQISSANASIRNASLWQNSIGQIVTFAEGTKVYNKDIDSVFFGLNASLLPNNFSILGQLEGKEVFSFTNDDISIIDIDNDKEEVVVNYIPWRLVGKIAKYLFDAISYIMMAKNFYDEVHSEEKVKVKEILDESHRYLIGYEVEVTYDPLPFEATINERKFIIDSVSVKYQNIIPEQLRGKKSSIYSLVGEQITAYSIPYFDIENITGVK